MIDFRTHLISIIAIFFALATGIALGAGPLKGNIDEQLTNRVDDLGTENQRLRDSIGDLQRRSDFQGAFVEQVASALVKGRLADESVVVVALPGADDATVTQVSSGLKAAGAEVTAQVAVTDAWAKPDNETVLDTLATQLVSPGVTLPSGSAYDRAGTVLGAALLTQADPPPTTASESAQTTLTAMSEAGVIDAPTTAPPPAHLALVVAGPQVKGQDPAPFTSLVAALDAAGKGSVVSGPPSAAADGGVVAAIRADSGLSADVSTVDAIDLPAGIVVSVYALAQQLAGGSGQYGYVGTTDGPLPEPATPSPS